MKTETKQIFLTAIFTASLAIAGGLYFGLQEKPNVICSCKPTTIENETRYEFYCMYCDIEFGGLTLEDKKAALFQHDNCEFPMLPEDIDACFTWAFGKGWRKLDSSQKPGIWNERHSDIFIINRYDEIGPTTIKIFKAWKKSKQSAEDPNNVAILYFDMLGGREYLSIW